MDRLRSGFHRKPRKESPARPTIVTDTSSVRSRITTPEPGFQSALQIPSIPVKQKTSSPVFRTLRELHRSHKRARSPATRSDTTSPLSTMSARDTPSDRFMVSPHPLSAVSPVSDSNENNGADHATQNTGPKMPSFLTLQAHEIDAKFQEIIWLERGRSLAGASDHPPDFRWARLKGDHKKLDRYMNIQPWENNRVRLRVPAGKQDYINASPVVLRSVSPAELQSRKEKSLEDITDAGVDQYIAMQGPKQKTTDHTWRMIVEQLDSPAVIVMLTETHEGDHEKCYPYFPRSPDDAPLEIGRKDEFRDGFRASVRCEAIEETEAGEAIELRKLVIKVYKGSKLRSEATNGAASDYSTPVERKSVDDNGDVQMFSPAKTDPDEGAAPAAASEDDDTASLTAQTGRASSDLAPDAAATSAQQPTPRDDDARSLAEHGYEERIVWHFLYKKWPDFGVPALEDIDSFFTLMRLSREKNVNSTNPRIVHCSAGVGRTGTFIALEHLMRELDTGVLENWDASLSHAPQPEPATSGDGDAAGTEDSGPAKAESGDAGDWAQMDVEEADIEERISFDSDDLIFHTVNQLREQRRHMVQAEPQYHFLYQVLRKLWEDKYGAALKASSAATSPGAGDHSNPRSSGTDGEPAPKRVEFDPFVEE